MSGKIRKLVFWGILQLGLMISPPAHSASLQCDYPGIDQAGLIANAQFNVDLPQFGAVCFVARKIILPDQVEPTHIVLELFQSGKKIYTLPEPEVGLLDGFCDVTAVSFPKLGKDERKSIVVLLRCTTTREEVAETAIYLPEDLGFKPDTELSLKTTNLDTIAKVVAKVKKLLAQRKK